ncbi:unnamed protein product [Pieris brassicae]|uniref:Uncharacterized protein n=1 Tax=Pieris brassicae TaxID=7116 RepID=A0A9P0TAL8_PIEBR|nr:unnamed protein product [Pieris brassicae]
MKILYPSQKDLHCMIFTSFGSYRNHCTLNTITSRRKLKHRRESSPQKSKGLTKLERLDLEHGWRRATLTLQLFLRLPELLQFGEVLVEDEHLGEAERGHGGRRARITLSGRAASLVRVHSATTRAHRLSPTEE